MFRVKVEVKGISPLLQNRFPIEDFMEGNRTTQKGKGADKRIYDPQEESLKRLYKTSEGEIYQPAEHFEKSMEKAAVNFKMKGRKTFKDAIQAGVIVTPFAIIHKIQKWEIDLRRVVIQGKAILRARPMFPEWELSFNLECIDDRIRPEEIKDILDYAGKFVGVGDFRPKFGRFMVTKFESN